MEPCINWNINTWFIRQDDTCVYRPPVSSDLYDLIGERIRARRLALAMTQAQLAEQVGLTIESLSRAERGRVMPTIRTLGHLAAALHTTLEALAEGRSSPESNFVRHSREQSRPELTRLTQLAARLDRKTVGRVIQIVELLPARHS